MKSLDSITKEEFESFEAVRESGAVNMFSPDVRDLAGIDRDTHRAIIQNYDALCSKWSDVRDLSS